MLIVSGLIATACSLGSAVDVIYLTDGSAALPDHPKIAPSQLIGVRAAEARGCGLAELGLAELRAFSPLVGTDVFKVLTLEGSLASRNHPGGTAPTQVRAAVKRARKFLN